MDETILNKERERLEKELRQKILKEINDEYYLTPKSKKLSTSDIFDKYKKDIIQKFFPNERHNAYSQCESTKQAINRLVCMKFGVYVLKQVPTDKFKEFREEYERIITEYIGIERKD